MTDSIPEEIKYRTSIFKDTSAWWHVSIERHTGEDWKNIYSHTQSYFKFNAVYRANKFIREYNHRLNNPSSGYRFHDANGKRVRRWEK